MLFGRFVFDFTRYLYMIRHCLFIILALSLNFTPVFAQNHFIYIQAETKKAFTVNVNDKTFYSTGAGYVIIPRLKSGMYELEVKFSDADIPAAKFTAVIDKKDVGYTVKDIGNNAVALMNIQTYVSLSAVPVETYAKVDNNAAETNKPEAEITSTNNNSGVQTTNASTKKSVAKNVKSSLNAKSTLKKGINKIAEIKGADNVSLLFIDVQGSTIDTIDVVIPAPKAPIKSTLNRDNNNGFLFKWASSGLKNEEEDFEYQDGYNTRCVHLLTKQDVARLRKRMAAATSEDKMIQEALQYSKNKCFTTLQVRNLSALFLKDQGKYKFFAALYNFVYDYVHYPTLQREFSDTFYMNKLLTMLHG